MRVSKIFKSTLMHIELGKQRCECHRRHDEHVCVLLGEGS